MQKEREFRGDYFVDKLGGWTEVLLALVSIGIIYNRLRQPVDASRPGDLALGLMFAFEVIGAILITFSKKPLMRAAFWIFAVRFLAGLGYMGVIHGDKLARSTLGFPFVVMIYCWVRVRALDARP